MTKRGLKMGRIKAVALLVGLAIVIAGCTSTYKPPLDIPAAPYVLPNISGSGDPVRIKDTTDPNMVVTSRGGSITFNSNLSQYSAALIASLERELIKNGFKFSQDASKEIDIAVIDVEMAFPKKFRCDMNIRIELDGKVIGIATDSETSNSESKAIDASIADAVRRIISNEEVFTYLIR
jgi:hypothetical protein